MALDTIAMAKVKSAVMNNVCKSEGGSERREGVRGGNKCEGAREVVYYVPACSAIS